MVCTAIAVMEPPSTSHQALDAKPENTTSGFATWNKMTNRKNASVVAGSASHPKAQQAIANPTSSAASISVFVPGSPPGTNQSAATTPARRRIGR